MSDARALRRNQLWPSLPRLERAKPDWHYRPPEKRAAVFHVANVLIDVAESDLQSRAQLPKGRAGASKVALREFEREVACQLSETTAGNVRTLLKLLPNDLLTEDLEFGVTADSFATLTWYGDESTAALSVGEEPSVYFSTANKNGQKVRGCKSFEKIRTVVGAIRDA